MALVVPGAGLYNAAAGLTNAYSRSTPVLLVAGQIPRGAIGKNMGAVHEIANQPDAVRSVTKWQRLALRPREIPDAVSEAFRQMRTGRPRPVLLEIPPDAGVEREEVELRNPARISRIVPSQEDLREAANDHRRVSLAADIRGWRRGEVRRGGGPRQAGGVDEHTRRYLQRRQGNDAGQPSAVLRLLFQPSRRQTRDEPALRSDAVRGRGDRYRRTLFAGQSGGRVIHSGEHQHRRRRAHPGPVQHHTAPRRRQGHDRSPDSASHRGRGWRASITRGSRRRGPQPHSLLRHPAQGAPVRRSWRRYKTRFRRTPSWSGTSRSSATTPAPTTR